MTDQFDVDLEDPVLLEEVELVSSLMVAAGETEGDLDDSQIDRLLGVESSEDAPDTAGGGPTPV